MSFKSIRNAPSRKTRRSSGKLMTLAECWEYFRKSVIPEEADADTVRRARMVFYTGAAFYQDQVLTIGDLANKGLTDDDGAAQLEKLAVELDEFAGELAIDVAFKMPARPAGRRMH